MVWNEHLFALWFWPINDIVIGNVFVCFLFENEEESVMACLKLNRSKAGLLFCLSEFVKKKNRKESAMPVYRVAPHSLDYTQICAIFFYFDRADKRSKENFRKLIECFIFFVSLFFLICNSFWWGVDPFRWGNSVEVAVAFEVLRICFLMFVCLSHYFFFCLLFKNFPLVHQLVTNWFCVKTNNNDSFETATTRWYGERSVKRKQSRWWWTGWKK